MKKYPMLDLPALCGAKTRSGRPCRNAPMLPSLRCSKHGGKTPIKHGGRSKLILSMRRQAKLLRMEMRGIEAGVRKEIKG